VVPGDRRSCSGWGGSSYLVGGFNHLEKYESQLGLPFPIYGKIKNVPNHQPVTYEITILRFP
jgi:hypothetical protein